MKRYGKWVDKNGFDVGWEDENHTFTEKSCYCSQCGEWLTASDEYSTIGKYCPNCGAKMEEDVEMETYKKAISKYGEAAQIDMAIEEMSELTKALCKSRRAANSGELNPHIYYNIAEEMADVTIMLEQLCLIFWNRENVEEIIKEKTARLAENIQIFENRLEKVTGIGEVVKENPEIEGE